MKKGVVDVIIFVDIKNNNFSLLKVCKNNLEQAKLTSIKICGNILLKSIFKKHLYELLTKANFNKNFTYKVKLVLPNEFFKMETVVLPSNFKNNLFPKNSILKCLDNNLTNFNYKKNDIKKNKVYYNVFGVSRWVGEIFVSLCKVFKIKSNLIISSSCSEIEFLNNFTNFKEQDFVLANFFENDCEIKLFKTNECVKHIYLKNINTLKQDESFISICKSLELYDLLDSKKNTFTSRNKLNLQNVVKYINLYSKQTDNILVMCDNNNENIINSLKQIDAKNHYININNLIPKGINLNYLELLGGLKFNNNNSFKIFNFNLKNKLIFKLKIFATNFKVYVKYLKNKLFEKKGNNVIITSE